MQKFQTMLFWYMLVLLIFILLYPKFPLLNVANTFVAIRIEDLLIALGLGIWGIYFVLAKKVTGILQNSIVQAMLIFFFISVVSLISAIFITQTIKPHLGILHFLRRVELMMLLPVAFTVFTTKKKLIITLISLSVVLFLVNMYAFGQQYLGWPVISTTNSEFSKGQILYLTPGARVNSTFAGHYDLAVFLAMSLVILSAMIFTTLKNTALFVWTSILGSISFVVLMMTAARQSFVAVVIGIIASLFLTGKKLFILLIILLAVGALLYPSQLRDRFISTILINVQNQGERFEPQSEEQAQNSKLNIPTIPGYKEATEASESTQSATPSSIASDISPGEPLDSTQLGVYRSWAIRLNVEWPRAIRALEKNPILGTGYSSLELATDNDILRSLGEVGLLGTLALGMVIAVILKEIGQIYVRSKDKVIKYFSAGVLAMALAFIINSLFIDVFEASKVATLFWIILGVNLGLRAEE